MVRSAVALASMLAIGSARGAEESATLFIAGELSAPGKLTLTDLKALGPAPIEWTVHGRAWEVDGKPLSPEEAPFRIVVTTDKEPSRSLYKLTRLEVVDLGAR
jgi:hypothetical protein